MTENPSPLTRPWPDIASHFRNAPSPSHKAIADLCDYIIARPARSGVHGWTSMYVLGITQIPVSYPYQGPKLQIEPVSAHEVDFRYVDTHIKSRTWTRIEPADRVIERFRKTMVQLNWFTDPSVLD